MADKPIAYLSAADQLGLFASRELSPVEVLEAQVEQYERVGERVNAFSITHFDSAFDAARESEKRWGKGTARPLEGITVAIKDESAVKGWTAPNGCRLMADPVSQFNAPIIDKLEAAGVVMHAQTTTPELSILPVTWNDLFGVTRNPWDPSCTCGGSSGGAGAALAAGTTTLATGSDMAGSIRIPSSLNGLYGFKAPFGRIPPTPPWDMLPFAADGPMARTLDDTVLMENVMAGPHPATHVAIRPKLELPATWEPITGWRIAYDLDLGFSRLAPDVRRNTEEALSRLERAGATLEEVDLAWDGDAITRAIVGGLVSTLIGSALVDLGERGETQLTSYARRALDMARGVDGPAQYSQCAQTTAALYSGLSAVFERGYRALVCPTVAADWAPADLNPFTTMVDVDGTPTVNWVLTPAFNLLNRNPVLSVPTGRAGNGVPTGMQIVGPTYDDATCFRIGAAHQAQFEGLFTEGRFPDLRSTDEGNIHG